MDTDAALDGRPSGPPDAELAGSGSGRFRGGVPEWSKGADCKSVGYAYGGSNPPPPTIRLRSVPLGTERE